MTNAITVTLHREVAEEIVAALRGHAMHLNEAVDTCAKARVNERTLNLIMDAVRISQEGIKIMEAAL